MVDITKSEATILRDIALNGPATGYTISKRTGLSKKTAYTSPKGLVDKELLSVSVVGKTRAGLDMKVYNPTLLGILKAFPFARPERWQSIMKRWSDLAPLVLGKWDFFVSAGVEDLAMRRLKIAAVASITGTAFVPHRIPYEIAMSQSQALEFFCYNFYHPEVGYHSREEQVRWAEACRTDVEVRNHLIEILKMNILSHHNKKLEAENMLDILQGKVR